MSFLCCVQNSLEAKKVTWLASKIFEGIANKHNVNHYNLLNISENDRANDKVGSSVATGATATTKK